jgi:predicted CXXCH cytochrome family protein
MRHGPVREGRCPDCHEPHGTDTWRLLKGNFPSTPYTPFDGAETYSLCFRCHDARLLADPKLVEPPVSNEDLTKDLALTELPDGPRLARAGITGFRNGTENLHFRHINKIDKGRPCRLCHDVHASANPKHIRDTTPFGKWEFRLNYKKSTTGGSCWPGCHVERRYDRHVHQENPR